MQFAEEGNNEGVSVSDGRTVACITYFKCNKLGHFADFCHKGVKFGEQNYMNTIEINVDSIPETLKSKAEQDIAQMKGRGLTSG